MDISKKLFSAEQKIKKLKQELANKQALLDNFSNHTSSLFANTYFNSSFLPIPFDPIFSFNNQYNIARFDSNKHTNIANIPYNISENLPVVLWNAKFDSKNHCKYFYIGKSIYDLISIDALTFIKTPSKWFKLVPFEDRFNFAKILPKQKNTNLIANARYRLNLHKNKQLWVKDKINIKKNEDGTIEFYGAITDISSANNHEKYLSLTMRLPIALYRSTPDGRITFANNALLKLIGCKSFEELQKIRAQQLFYNYADREAFFNSCDETNKPIKVEYRLKTLDGQVKWVRDTSYFIFNNNKTDIIFEGFIEDITNEKKLEEKLTKKQIFLTSLINSLPLNVFAKSAIGNRFQLWNKSCEDYFGFTEFQAIGKKSSELFGEKLGKRFYEEDKQVIQSYTSQTFEEKLKTKKGIRYFKTTKVPVFNSENKPLYVLGISEDITKQKNAEASAIESEKRLKTLVEATHDMFGIYTPQGKCLYYYGPDWEVTKNDEIAGKFLNQIEPKVLTEHYYKQVQKCYTFQKNVTSESQLNCNNSIEYYSDAFYPIFDNFEKVVAIGHIGHNISDSKTSKHLLLKYLKRLTNIQELETKVMQQHSLKDISQVALSELKTLIKYDLARVCLMHPDENKLIILTWISRTNFDFDIYNLDAPYNNFEDTKKAKAIVIEFDELENHLFAKSKVKSFYAIPLMHQNKVFGMLELFSKTSNYFGEFIQNIGADVGSFLSLAMYKAKLSEQTRNDAAIKEILISEINHRVKNNLTSIIGLLYAQLNHSSPEKKEIYQEIIGNITSRIRGLATVHDLLSAGKWNPLPIGDLIKQVAENAIAMLDTRILINLEIANCNVKVSSRYVHSLALICNELVTNMCKYSFKNKKQGNIKIDFDTKSKLEILFSDDGPGYPQQIIETKKGNVGMYLILNLVKFDLKGDIKFYNKSGANTLISLPNEVLEEEL